MLKIIGKRVYLREIVEADLSQLHVWRNKSKFREFVTNRRDALTYEEFKSEISADFFRDRYLQCMVIVRGQAVGTLYAYDYHRADGYLFVSAYIDESRERMGYGAEALALFLEYLFREIGLYKVYCDTYSYNNHSVEILTRAGFAEEGRFIGHRLRAGQRYDVQRFALYGNMLPTLTAFVDRLTRRSHTK